MIRFAFLMSVGFATSVAACGSSTTPSGGGSPLSGSGAAPSSSGGAAGSGGVLGESGGVGAGGAPSTGAGGTPSAGNGGSPGTGGSSFGADAGKVTADDFAATASTFQCIQRGTKIRNFYLVNELGHLNEAVAVANSANGGTYPVGTIIQLIPTEAMVKRGAGFSSETNDWEFFSLSTTASGTTIVNRGTKNVVNQFSGNCFDCHAKAEPQFDFVCEETHGCDPLPLTPQIIQAVQQSDPRCP
jgi:hypothetical protein